MKKRFLSLLSLIVVLSMALSMLVVCAEETENPAAEVMTKETFVSSVNTALPYRLYVPADYNAEKEYSFLLFLHGAGNRGDTNESQVSANTGLINRIITGETVTYDGEVIDSSKEFIIVAPQCQKEYQWVDTPWSVKPDPSYKLDEIPQSQYMTAVVELIGQMQEKYNLNSSRMYITGLSMGGFGTWDLLMRYPDLFAAAIPMGGAGDTSKADVIKNIPVWTFHQLHDPTVSSAGTVAMVKALTEVGAEVKFTPYFDPIHNAWTKGYAEPELLQWLYSHTKEDKNEEAVQTNPITDGASDWAKGEVALAYASGIMPKQIADSYQADITREEFCEMVVNILPQSLEASRTAEFADCENNAVEYAYSVGVVNGVSNTEFAPSAKATREEMATMLYRAYKLIAPEAMPTLSVDHPDKDLISEWAVEAVDFMSESGIMLGDDEGNIMPKQNTTREQATLLVYRTYCSAQVYGKEI
ncbi:MAG: hypothetical protein E7395_01355 [Ruminococcaceae bacterium]|nr:hypothetical protein [Oscillospiraceae bacterium]